MTVTRLLICSEKDCLRPTLEYKGKWYKARLPHMNEIIFFICNETIEKLSDNSIIFNHRGISIGQAPPHMESKHLRKKILSGIEIIETSVTQDKKEEKPNES
ncbi:MAG: hypothetical protein V3U54_12825 [Thermodesulfobacteriota bacterium]